MAKPNATSVTKARAILDGIMGAFNIKNADTYSGTQPSLIDFSQPGSMTKIRATYGYTEKEMLAWGARAIDERCGNCDDVAAAVCTLLHGAKYPYQYEYAVAPGHAFVIVERAGGGIGKVTPIDRWGDAAFIIDYWWPINVGSANKKQQTPTDPMICNPGSVAWFKNHAANGAMECRTYFMMNLIEL
jgi:hypothetical protein